MNAARSMVQHAACARMSIAFGYTAVSEASWPQRPLASAMSLQPVPVCRGSALAGAYDSRAAHLRKLDIPLCFFAIPAKTQESNAKCET